MKSPPKPSKFNVLRCCYSSENSSPEEKPHNRASEHLMSEIIEYEKLDIQEFPQTEINKKTTIESPTQLDLNDQIIENSVNESTMRNAILLEDMNSPYIKVKNNNHTIVDQKIDESYVDEIIKRHRHTFSRRVLDSAKDVKPEEIEKNYMSAMGKSIVALNYKSKISKNPMKKFVTLGTQKSTEENKSEEINNGSPINKITLIPIHKFFRMPSQEEINFIEKNIEKQQFISPIESVVETSKEIFANIRETINIDNKIVGSRMFEDLVIIGVDKSDINSLSNGKDLEGKQHTLMPKILYSFRNEGESQDLA